MNKITLQEITKQFEAHIQMQKKFATQPADKWEEIFKLATNMDSHKKTTLHRAALSHLLTIYPDKVLLLLQRKKSFLADQQYEPIWEYVIKHALSNEPEMAKKLIPLVPSIQKTTSIGTWITNAVNDDIRNFLISHWKFDHVEQPLSWYTANGERVLYLTKPSVRIMVAAALSAKKPTIHPNMDPDLKNVINGLDTVKSLYPERYDWLPMAKKVLKQYFDNKHLPVEEDLNWLPDPEV